MVSHGFFCVTLKLMKGLVLHDTFSGSLTKLMAGKMPEFETGFIQVYENDKNVMRQYFCVTDMKESIQMNLLGIF